MCSIELVGENEVPLTSASFAVSASCSVMDARELSLCLSGLASSLRSPFSEGSEEKEAIGARVREILMASGRCQEVDGQGSSLDGASLSTLLWSAAKLGLPMGRSAREAALSCARRLVLSLAGRGGEKEGRRLVATLWALDKIGCSPSRSWLEQVEILSELS